MSGILEQFEIVARQLERLTVEAGNQPSAVTPDWIQRAQAALSAADALIKEHAGSMDHFNFCAEIKHYHSALLKLKEAVEKGQAHLGTRNSTLQREHSRLKRVQNWAETVEVLT